MTLLVAVCLAVLLGALAQSVSGIGFSLVCGPLLVAALGPADGVRLGVLLSLVLNLVLLVRHRHDADLGRALLLLVPAAAVTPLAARALRGAPVRLAEALAGAAALVGALALAGGLRWRAAGGAVGAVVAGAMSATMNVVAAIGGPAVALYAANAGWPAAAARSTLQLYFLALNVVALAVLGLPDVAPGTWAVTVAALVVGTVAGAPTARWVPERGARAATLALAGSGGLLVLLRAAV
ncbi:MAG TPA: TSUP family transporter [Mycobacteriales bacterium]|nr:TSUP family transporter [Mycobacteriales bacterium]